MKHSRRAVVDRVHIVPVRVEHVLIDGVALLSVYLPGVLLRQAIKRFFDRYPHGRAGSLLFAPVEHDLGSASWWGVCKETTIFQSHT
jgi:hypothetical protein